MFTADSIISSVQSAQKSILSYVTDKQLRESLTDIVNAQASFAQVVSKSITDIATNVGKQMNSFDVANLCTPAK